MIKKMMRRVRTLTLVEYEGERVVAEERRRGSRWRSAPAERIAGDAIDIFVFPGKTYALTWRFVTSGS
jgi:hypothetical protein